MYLKIIQMSTNDTVLSREVHCEKGVTSAVLASNINAIKLLSKCTFLKMYSSRVYVPCIYLHAR